MEKQLDFFTLNDQKVNKRLTKVLLWMTLVFPALFLLTAVGVFWIEYDALTKLTAIGVFCTVGPFLLHKAGVPAGVMKYVSVLAVAFIIMLLGTNCAVGIYMTFGMAQLFSLMYFDKKFTLRISIVAYIFMLISHWFRVKDAAVHSPGMDLRFIPYSMGFTIEFVLMTCVFMSVAGASRKILENLHSTEQTIAIMDKCGNVSESLVGMMNKLAGDMSESRRATEAIVKSANETLDNCAVSKSHVDTMQGTVNEMVTATAAIDGKTTEMLEISDDIYTRMQSYVEQMDKAVESMREIEASADMTGSSIHSLETVIAEITSLVKEITQISDQTNILAINASIESAHAGEHGKGFAVVSGEIRMLAERSKVASVSIAEVVEKVLEMLDEVKKANTENLSSVDNGITQISGARESAIEIGKLQADSRSKTEEIAENSRQTGQRSKQVHEMAQQMGELVQNSYTRANSIVNETTNQKKISTETSDTFGSVKTIADELFELSKAGKQTEG